MSDAVEAADAAEATPVAVEVLAPFQVYLDGQTYGPGESISAPPATAEQWLLHGWVSEHATKPATGRTAAPKAETTPGD